MSEPAPFEDAPDLSAGCATIVVYFAPQLALDAPALIRKLDNKLYGSAGNAIYDAMERAAADPQLLAHPQRVASRVC